MDWMNYGTKKFLVTGKEKQAIMKIKTAWNVY
jgi:hypothetical protein